MPRAKKARVRRCKWCKKPLDKGRHRNVSESLCFVKNETAIRSAQRPKVKTLSDAYDTNNKLRSEFQGTDMEQKLLKRQYELGIDASLAEYGDVKPPRSLKYILREPFVWAQINTRYPWSIIVVKDGKRLQLKRNNLKEAVLDYVKLKRKYPHTYLISRARSYDIPPEWRFKKDELKAKIKWCPRCVDFRIFKKVEPQEEFFAMKKVRKTDKKGELKFEWVERKVFLIECVVCGCNNRDPIYRRSNQPWQLRKIKKGVRRVKRTEGLPKRKGKRRGKR